MVFPFFKKMWKHIFIPNKSKESFPFVSTLSPLFLQDESHTLVPYEKLWRSALRCKMVHCSQEDIQKMWYLTNVPSEEEISPFLEEEYLKELQAVSLPIYLTTHGEFKNIDISVYFWNNEDTIYLTFKTDPDSELLFLKKPMELFPIFGNVCVHRFLYKRLLSVIQPLVFYLELFKNSKYTLVLAGYSMGATMAEIAASILSRMFPNLIVHCHALGGMKPGNHEFADWAIPCIHEHYRIINGNDPFVLLPVDSKWSHIPRVTIHFERHLYAHIFYKETPWYKKFFIEKRLLNKVKKKLQYMNDHPCDKYIEQLWAYTRMAAYLVSMCEAEELVQTPL